MARNTRATPTRRSTRIIGEPPLAVGVSGSAGRIPCRARLASPAHAYSTSPFAVNFIQPSPRHSRRLRLLGSVSARTSFSPRLATLVACGSLAVSQLELHSALASPLSSPAAPRQCLSSNFIQPSPRHSRRLRLLGSVSARTSAEHPVAAVDADGLPGDVRRVIGEKEDDGARDLLREAEPTERDRVEQAPLPGRAHGFPLPLGGRIRANEARRHAVHADAMGAQLARGLAGEADEARLRAGIGLDAREAVGASRAR